MEAMEEYDFEKKNDRRYIGKCFASRWGNESWALDYELVEHIDYWYNELLKADREDYLFVVTENSGDVAMVMITKNKTIYVNEAM